jgi:DNA-binding beta-propeller fold protein YncE
MKRTRTPLSYLGTALGGLVSLALASGASGCKKAKPAPTEASGHTTVGARVPTPTARVIYVTNNGSDSLSAIDRDGDTVTTVSVDYDPDAREAPHHVARTKGGESLFVALAFPPEGLSAKKKDPHGGHGASSQPGALAKVDPGTLAVLATRDVDENPGDVVTTHDGTRAIVTHYDMKRAMTVAAQGNASPSTMFAKIQVWDTRSFAKLGERPVCVAPHGTAISEDDTRAIVACYGSDEIVVVDLTKPQLPVARYPLGNAQGVPGVPRYGPYSVTLVPGGSEAVVADIESNDLRIFDLDTKAFRGERTIVLGAKAFMPAVVDAHTAYVPLQAPDSLVRVDLATGKIVAQVVKPPDECRAPHAFGVSHGRVFVVCEGDHKGPGTVLEVDPTSLATRRRWTVGVYPDGLAFGD